MSYLYLHAGDEAPEGWVNVVSENIRSYVLAEITIDEVINSLWKWVISSYGIELPDDARNWGVTVRMSREEIATKYPNVGQ